MEFDSDIAIDVKPPATLINTNESSSQPANKSINRTSSDSNKSVKHKVTTVASIDNEGDSSKSEVGQQIVQTISVDHLGRPIYPINIGNELIVYDLGEIFSDRPGYHSENWIYPIGFVATRVYGHMKEPDRKCTYTCKITDGGEFPRYFLYNTLYLVIHSCRIRLLFLELSFSAPLAFSVCNYCKTCFVC